MKNLSKLLAITLTTSSILGYSQGQDGPGKLSNEERAAQEAQRQKDLANPDVEVVKLTDHFKSAPDSKLSSQDKAEIFAGVSGEIIAGWAIPTLVVNLSKAKDGDKIINKLAKKGFRVTAKAARVYFITDGVTKIFIRFQELDPTITALPGATAWAVREAHEFALEAPERAKRIPGAVHESVNGVIKSVKGQANE
ncbi:MAG: hypothetical protein KA116_06350 [Proteobacteria bacterium]|nr:hypothetical protein [Pseudomonadota bacterium]